MFQALASAWRLTWRQLRSWKSLPLASLITFFSRFSSCLSGQNGHSFLVTFGDLAFFTLNVCAGQDSVLSISTKSLGCCSFITLPPKYWTIPSFLLSGRSPFWLPPGYLLDVHRHIKFHMPYTKLIFSVDLFLLTLFLRGWHHLVPKLELLCSPDFVCFLCLVYTFWQVILFERIFFFKCQLSLTLC